MKPNETYIHKNHRLLVEQIFYPMKITHCTVLYNIELTVDCSAHATENCKQQNHNLDC